MGPLTGHVRAGSGSDSVLASVVSPPRLARRYRHGDPADIRPLLALLSGSSRLADRLQPEGTTSPSASKVKG